MEHVELLTPARALPALPATRRGLSTILFRCLLEARPAVQGIFLIRFLTGVALSAHQGGMQVTQVIAGTVVWYLATLYVYLINGAMDVVEDRTNGSRRPIASGLLKASEVIIVARGCAVAAVLGAYVADRRMLLPTLLLIGLGHLYSVPPFVFKRYSGAAAATAALGGVMTYYAGAVTGDGGVGSALLLLTVTMSLWMGVVGTQAKDLSDVEGDRVAGRQTIAVRWSEWAVRATLALSAIAVGGTFLIIAHLAQPRLVVPAALVCLGAIVLSVATVTGRHTDSRKRRRLPYRIFMVTQYAAHLGLVVWVIAQ